MTSKKEAKAKKEKNLLSQNRKRNSRKKIFLSYFPVALRLFIGIIKVEQHIDFFAVLLSPVLDGLE